MLVPTTSSLYQMDVKSAFLNRYINELMYVEQPLGFEDEKKPYVQSQRRSSACSLLECSEVLTMGVQEW